MSDAQVEIPFVPASQRPAKQEEKDTIVIVGKVRQKRKRKADLPAEKVEEPFDFSSVPNILDDDHEPVKEEEETDKRRKKQKKTNKKGLSIGSKSVKLLVIFFFCG